MSDVITSAPDPSPEDIPPQAPIALPPRGGGHAWLWKWISTNNPFYVISAGFFLAGLWISFPDQTQAENTWALMGGLAGYTLLLAVTAWFLVRRCKLWDDARTVLLLVVLLFLATSVTFDHVLVVIDPGRGRFCFLLGWLLAVAVSEGLLRGIRLGLPGWYRGTYHLILALFFLAPLAIEPLTNTGRNPAIRNEALLWSLFAFPAVLGAAFLLLLPAIRKGARFVQDNGSPWPWPLYPWTLFGLLALAAPARAYLLSWSFDVLPARFGESKIFGLYFLIPLALAWGLLLLEAALVTKNDWARFLAWISPLALLALAHFGHRGDLVYLEFLETFQLRLGSTPLYLTLWICVGYYLLAGVRGLPGAWEGLALALIGLSWIGPRSLVFGEWTAFQPAWMALAALVLLTKGLLARTPWRVYLGCAALAGGLAQWYVGVRKALMGMDLLVLSALVFFVAIAISIHKARQAPEAEQ